MIWDVHPGSRIQIRIFFNPGSESRGQKSTGSRIPDSQHWLFGIPGKGLHVLEDSEAGPEQRIVGGPEIARLQGHCERANALERKKRGKWSGMRKRSGI